VRFTATLVFWLATTVGLAIAVPVVWTQRHVVEADGYTAIAQQAAGDPTLQSAMAAELTTRAIALIAAHNGGRRPADSTQVHAVAAAFTAGPDFPALFAQANRSAHDWLFTEPPAGQDGNQWIVDLAPMLNTASIQQLLHSYHVTVPANLAVPVTVSVPSMSQPLRQGQLSELPTWGRWASKGAAAGCGLCALLTLLAARRRGMALTCLGVSALLVGATGWAGIEAGARYVNNALNLTAGNVRQIADVMVGEAGASLRQWLNFTLAAGAGLVIVGVFVAMTGSVVLGKKGS
jgi:hypothetical protein